MAVVDKVIAIINWLTFIVGPLSAFIQKPNSLVNSVAVHIAGNSTFCTNNTQNEIFGSEVLQIANDNHFVLHSTVETSA